MSDDSKPDDAAILFSDETLEVGGRTVEVREFRYLDGMTAAARARPLLEAMQAAMADGDDITPARLDQIIGDHAATWLLLIAMATREDAEWIASLPDAEGLALSLAFWRVNGPFFVRRLVLGAAAAEAARQSRSHESSPASSRQGSGETSTISPAA